MTEEVLDRRAVLSAAMDAVEPEETPEVTPAPTPEASVTPPPEPDAPSPTHEETGKPPVAPESEVEKPDSTTFAVDKAPQSWRAPQKAKWDKLDPDVRQEVMRREREITKTLGETSQARQFSHQFNEAVQPYQAHLQARGAAPLAAFQELLKADYMLTTAPKDQRAQFMAKLIQDYRVDVAELDAALAGTVSADPVASKVEQLLQERLAPFQQYMTAQQAREQQVAQASSAKMAQELENMAVDPKFPHFQEVRGDMADVVELAAKKGLYLSLPEAYTRAIALNPEVSQQVAAKREEDARKASALAANAKAQKALKASVSVGGSPGGLPSGASLASDRRSLISAAFNEMEGR